MLKKTLDPSRNKKNDPKPIQNEFLKKNCNKRSTLAAFTP
jgi:hypothetical protein